MEIVLLLIIIILLLFKNDSQSSSGTGNVKIPVANFKHPNVPSSKGGKNPPPTTPKPAFRPPSQYKKIEVKKETICKLNNCCCRCKED